jgi:outer membrane protein assembly factor BamB
MWERAHADGANSGFAGVATAPAGRGSVSVPGLGTFAPGAGPVIAPDGTVYLGNEQGKLMSFKPDGTRGWSRDIAPGQSIVASPVIDRMAPSTSSASASKSCAISGSIRPPSPPRTNRP